MFSMAAGDVSMEEKRITKIEDSVGLSVIIPAYNEAAGIAAVLVDISQVLCSLDIPWEIIVVDDGSRDHTGELVSVACATDPEIRLLHHRRNLGYGAALKTGIRQARYEWVCITDADGTYPADRIPVLLAELREHGCDMVVGARLGKQAAIPLVRRPAKWIIARLAETVAGEAIPDINSGMRVFRKDIVQRFFSLLPDGFSFTTTITLGMLINGYSVEYLPINYYARKGRSKIHPLYDTLRFIRLVLQIALYFAPLKIFLPLSLFLIFLGLGWAGFSYFILGRLADASTAVILMAAIQTAVVGLLADLINRRLGGYQKEQ
jgi:glycosyltransferase involved in cell wall biosynthesis